MEKTPKDTLEGKVLKVKIRKKQVDPSTLFTPIEVRHYVTEFVSSWIRGDIIIRFPTAAELSKKNPLAISFPAEPSLTEELKIKEHYIELLSVCAGTIPASTAEQEKAISDVFRMLLMFRSANRIEGKIISKDIERRIIILEEKVQSNSKLLEQITGFLFKEKKLNT
jgi:hypothetical protein